MLGTVQNLMHIPRLIADGAEATVETARLLPTLQRVLAMRLGSLDQALGEVVTALPGVATDLARVRDTVEPQQERVATIEHTIERLDTRVADLAGTLRLLRSDLAELADRLPDPDAPGPLARARDAIAGAA